MLVIRKYTRGSAKRNIRVTCLQINLMTQERHSILQGILRGMNGDTSEPYVEPS